MLITLLFTYNSTITCYGNHKIWLYVNASGGVPGYAMNQEWHVWKNYDRWLCHKYLPQIQCQLHDHAKQYDNDEVCHNKRNGGKLHGNISRSGYGNAIIGRYGGCFEEGIWYRRKLRGTREASNDGRVRVRIIHGLNISHKELTYILQKSISHPNQALRACS